MFLNITKKIQERILKKPTRVILETTNARNLNYNMSYFAMKDALKSLIFSAGHYSSKLIPDKTLRNLQDEIIYEPVIKRKKLRDSDFPLFESVLFELRTKCNSDCPFCPANVYFDKRKDETMPFGTYHKVISELKELNFSGRVSFHLNNEPLITPNLFDYVKVAVENLTEARKFHLSTNGLVLTKEKGEKIIASGINYITVNWYDDNFKAALPERLTDFEAMVNEYNMSNKKKINLSIGRRKKTTVLMNRAGLAPNKSSSGNINLRGFCSYPFTHLCINPEGNVGICCMDVYFREVIGNVNESKIIDIWHSDKLSHIRKHLLAGERNMLPVCDKCDHCGVQPGQINTYLKKFIYVLTK
jgi:radical SAM protein with 4Fe4S-binding SPASM domain